LDAYDSEYRDHDVLELLLGVNEAQASLENNSYKIVGVKKISHNANPNADNFDLINK